MATKPAVTRPAVRPAVKPAKPAGASQIAGRPTSTGGAALPNNPASPGMNKPMPAAGGGAMPPGLPPQVQALAADPAFRAHVLNGGAGSLPPVNAATGQPQRHWGPGGAPPAGFQSPMPGLPPGMPPDGVFSPGGIPASGFQPPTASQGPAPQNPMNRPPANPMGQWRGPNKLPGPGMTGTPVVDQVTPEISPGDELQRQTGGPLMAPPGGMDARAALRNALRGSGRSLFGPNYQQ